MNGFIHYTVSSTGRLIEAGIHDTFEAGDIIRLNGVPQLAICHPHYGWTFHRMDVDEYSDLLATQDDSSPRGQ